MRASNGSEGVSKTAEATTSSTRSPKAKFEEKERWFGDHVKSPLESLYRTYILEFLLRQKPLPPSVNGRHVPLRPKEDKPLVDERRGHTYISNSIRSSRYTVWNFIPKQCFFQATRLANFYFICIGIPQTIPGFSTTGSYTTILPLCFFLLLTIVKEGYDDYRRHRLDKIENNTFAIVLREKHHSSQAEVISQSVLSWLSSALGSLHIPLWSKGSNVQASKEEVVDDDTDPDLQWTRVRWHDIRVGDVMKLRRDDPVPADIVLLSSSGAESAAYVETMALDGETNLKSKQALRPLQVCHDIKGVQSCEANFVSEDPNRDLYNFTGSMTIDGKTLPLKLNEIILRGSVLRNTKVITGLVLYTGEECKIRMNANHHPAAKKPRLERFNNQVILTLIVYVVVLSIGCSVGYLLWHARTESHAWYLTQAFVPFKQIIIGFLIMFNNVIPLAMYVSLEIVKAGQMLMISGDIEMFDEETNTRMTCNTNTILENLGQVSFVLSDKTGTLTENIMKFRALSVAGTAWWHQRSERKSVQVEQRVSARTSLAVSPIAKEQAIDNEVSIVIQETEVSSEDLSTKASPGRPSLNRRSSDRSIREEAQSSTTDLRDYLHLRSDSSLSQKAHQLLLALSLCHTAIPEEKEDGTIDYQASSPDELALVRAAQELGFAVLSRSSQSITVLESDIEGSEARHEYEILEVIEFSSKRKRMSIVIRCPDGKILLLCKGADSVIVPRLQQAALASRKSHEVRRSVQIERDLRRSAGNTPRTSFGGRPSLTIRRRSSMDIRPSPKQQSLDVPTFRRSEKSLRPPLDRRNTDDRFAFLNEVSTTDDSLVFSRCFKHLDDFATTGLRTLLFAQREISQEDYSSWKKMYQDATTSLNNRQERIEAAGDVIEQGLDLLGATAIEDKLQEGVPETIDMLRRANMKIWMLTGDKRETAINIAHSANICQPGSDIYILDSKKGDIEGQLRDVTEDLHTTAFHGVIVIDGHTLSEVEADFTISNLFYSLITTADSVICCRASPAQKAGIVKAIRSRMSGLTLAIGDGANDIAMITASHVGIGISGKEGLQAARVADFSIAQFRFLQRLLLVHGHWNYVRTAKFILWTYWKEMFFYMVQALYQGYDGYTGSSLYENWSLTALNTLFTSLCVIIPGLYEQDFSATTLLAFPELYTYGQKNRGLNLPKYFVWMAVATLQGVIVWFLPWALYGRHNVMGDNGTFAVGDLCFSLAIMWTNVKLLLLETHYKTRIVAVGFTITVAGWWAWNAFLATAYSDNLSPYDVKHGFNQGFGTDLNWWLTLVITLAVLLTIELIWKSLRKLYPSSNNNHAAPNTTTNNQLSAS